MATVSYKRAFDAELIQEWVEEAERRLASLEAEVI